MMWKLSFLLFCCILPKALKGSTHVSNEEGLWALNNGKFEKLGNTNVKGFFKLCEGNVLYWTDGKTVDRGTSFDNQSEALTDHYNNGCIRSFDVDCAIPRLFILNSCERTVVTYTLQSEEKITLLLTLLPNRLVVDNIRQQLYLLYESSIQRYSLLNTLENERVPTPDNFKVTALIIYQEKIYVAYTSNNLYYIQKCGLDFKACENITQGIGYLQNLVIDQNKLLFLDSYFNTTIYEWSLIFHNFTTNYKVNNARDIQPSYRETKIIQLTSGGRISISNWVLGSFTAVFTKLVQL